MTHIMAISDLVGTTARMNMLHVAVKAVMNGQQPAGALGAAVASWWRDANYYGDASGAAQNLVGSVQRELQSRSTY